MTTHCGTCPCSYCAEYEERIEREFEALIDDFQYHLIPAAAAAMIKLAELGSEHGYTMREIYDMLMQAALEVSHAR